MSTALHVQSRSLHVYRFVQEQVDASLRCYRFAFDVARGIWTRSLAGGIEHFVSLPTDISSERGPVAVTANLGVHCRPLAARLAAMYDRPRARNLSTFTRNVGQLSARRAWREWFIRTPGDAERIARRLASRIVSVGVPWLTKFSGLAAVCEGLRAYGHEEHRQVALPLMERMLGGDAATEAGAFWTDDHDRRDGGGEPTIFAIAGGPIDPDAWHCDE